METLNKYFSTILLLIIVILIITNINYCNRSSTEIITTDTVTTVKVDTIKIRVFDSVKLKPNLVLESDTIYKYIDTTSNCKKIHLNELGVNLLRQRNYKDTTILSGFNVSYDASVIGELQSIELNLWGSIPKIKETHSQVITNTKYAKNSIGVYAGFNNTPYLGIEYKHKDVGYSLNYDLQCKSIGVQLSYTPFKW